MINDDTAGGAISIVNGNLTITGTADFHDNEATDGGAIHIYNSSASFIGKTLEFQHNIANKGGAIYIDSSHVISNTEFESMKFTDNVAQHSGDGMYITNSLEILTTQIISADFEKNRGSHVGAVHIDRTKNITFFNVSFTGNARCALSSHFSSVNFEGINSFSENRGVGCGALDFTHSTVDFNGNNDIENNKVEAGIMLENSIINFYGKTSISNNAGGGMQMFSSTSRFAGDTVLFNNSARIGGAINTQYGTIVFSGTTTLINNEAMDGGALYALSAMITLENTVIFTSNSAQNGGAMYLIGGTTLTLAPNSSFNSSYNSALNYGGGIYHKDTVTLIQCSYYTSTGFVDLPYCFLQLIQKEMIPSITVTSYHDSAGKDGGFLYGGLLDKCKLFREGINTYHKPNYFMDILNVIEQDNMTKSVSSEPFQLCFCDNYQDQDCTGVRNINVYRGQDFNVSVVAIGQGTSISSTRMLVRTAV